MRATAFKPVALARPTARRAAPVCVPAVGAVTKLSASVAPGEFCFGVCVTHLCACARVWWSEDVLDQGAGRGEGTMAVGSDGFAFSTRPRPTTLPATQHPALILATIADPPARGIARAVYDAVAPSAAFFDTLGLPAPLIHWGHPGNMAVVLFAMGFYGCAKLGADIRLSDDATAVATAKDLHPKLAIGMGVFFALGAVGGLMSLTMQGKPLLSSPHATTGLIGLALLALQGMLSAFFEDGQGARDAHAYLGFTLLALFSVHMVLGIQLGLSI